MKIPFPTRRYGWAKKSNILVRGVNFSRGGTERIGEFLAVVLLVVWNSFQAGKPSDVCGWVFRRGRKFRRFQLIKIKLGLLPQKFPIAEIMRPPPVGNYLLLNK